MVQAPTDLQSAALTLLTNYATSKNSRVKYAILVVGTGRSGTSAMAGSLKILGACLGQDLKPADPANTKGYFENTRITALNKVLLTEAGMDWYVSPADRTHAISVSTNRVARVSALVADVFADQSPILIKDPRLCVLVDVYVTALRNAGYAVHAVWMQRDASEVTRSIRSWGAGTEEAIAATVKRNTELLDEALRRTRVPCIDCTFNDLLSCTSETISRVTSQLPFLSCTDDQIQEVLHFVDQSLRRHGAA